MPKQQKGMQSRPKAPDIGVDPDWILNPAFRRFFGKEGDNIFTSYGLLLRVLCKTFYRDRINEIERTEGTKNSRTRMHKQVIRLGEWRKKFKKVIYDLTHQGKRMLSLGNRPKEGEDPSSTLVSLKGSGKAALQEYKKHEKDRMEIWVNLMEENLDDLWGKTNTSG